MTRIYADKEVSPVVCFAFICGLVTVTCCSVLMIWSHYYSSSALSGEETDDGDDENSSSEDDYREYEPETAVQRDMIVLDSP